MTTTVGTPLGVTASHRTYVPPTLPTAFLVGRWDASQLALTDNAPVDTWPDTSGFGRTLTKATAGAPVFRTAQLNGLPVVRFNGASDQYMAAATATTYKHVFVVTKYSASIFQTYAGLVTADVGAFIFIGQGGQPAFYMAGNEAGAYHKNGVLIDFGFPLGPMDAYAVVSLSLPAGWPNIKLQIGRDRDQPGRWWLGDIAEIVAYSEVLTTPVRQQVEAYLKAKWGTP